LNSSAFTRFPIIFEDSWFVAIDKPDGILSHPNPGKGSLSRNSAFEGSYSLEERKFQTPAGPIFLIHRLDQDTSGLLLAAKNSQIAETLRTYFERHQIKKTYTALVAGKLNPRTEEWKDHLAKRSDSAFVRSIILPNRSPNAKLKYQVQKIWNSHGHILSLLEIELLTGRTHQIRVQSAKIRHFVAGDRVYGDFSLNRELKASIGLRRLFLHACRLEFQHPTLKKPLILKSLLPTELENCLNQLSE
jgi:RluA family pseudouridine synthase